MNHFQSITTNLSPMVRKDKMEGKDYLVVPMVMLTEGVHNGSDGPLYYPPDELEKCPAVWNHKPIVIRHPSKDGKGISACTPQVLTESKVGVILGTTFTGGKLKAEAWLDPNRLKELAPTVMSAIQKGTPVEISTGLFTENEVVENGGEWQGERYTHVARNYRPDHLAILPDQKGACSIADGAGLLRNQEKGKIGVFERIIRAMSLFDLDMVQNQDASYEDVRQGLQDALKKSLPVDMSKGALVVPPPSPYILDIFPSFFIFELNGKLFKRGYKKGKNSVVLDDEGTVTEVKRVVEYRPVTNTRGKESKMEKEQKVDALIANEGSPWGPEDKEFLMGLDDVRLEKLNTIQNAFFPPKKDKEEEKPEENLPEDEEELEEEEDQQPMKNKGKGKKSPTKNAETAEEFVAKAPEAIREVLNAGLAAHKAEKAKLIKTITANSANVFTKEDLEKRPLSDLKGLAALAKPTANYAGQGDVVTENTSEEEPLVPPVMDFQQ